MFRALPAPLFSCIREHDSYLSAVPPVLVDTFPMGKRKKTAEDRIAAARAKGVPILEESGATGELVLREVEKGTKKNYDMMMDLWDA